MPIFIGIMFSENSCVGVAGFFFMAGLFIYLFFNQHIKELNNKISCNLCQLGIPTH